MSHYTPPPPDTRVKIPHLVFGLLFLGLAGLWALVAGGVVDLDTVPALGPGLLVAAGVIGLAASLANGRNRRRRYEQQDPYDQPAQPEHDRLDLLEDRDDTDQTEELR